MQRGGTADATEARDPNCPECASVTVNWAPPALPASLCSSSHLACDSGLRPGEPPLFIDGKFTGPRDRKSLQTNGLCGLTVGAAAGSPAEPGMLSAEFGREIPFSKPRIVHNGPGIRAKCLCSSRGYRFRRALQQTAASARRGRPTPEPAARGEKKPRLEAGLSEGPRSRDRLLQARSSLQICPVCALLVKPAERAVRSRRGGRRGARPRRAAMTNPRDWRRKRQPLTVSASGETT